MLLRLVLREFVIVERAELEFGPGLNALTGETGAGKSILVDAIGLLAGTRGSVEWIRRGAARLLVEGALDLAQAPAAREAAARQGIPLEDGVLLLRREIAADGRSHCFAGDRQVLVSQLRELTAGALWTVGQGDQRVLADPAEQEAILDRFGEAEEARTRYRSARASFLDAVEACARLAAEQDAFRKDAEFLRAQVNEIREADPAPGERARLRAAVERVRDRAEEVALQEELQARLVREEGSVLDHLETLVHRLRAADETLWGPLCGELESLRDRVRALEIPAADDEEEGDLEAMEERLRLLDRLCRRYGDGAAEEAGERAVLDHARALEERLEEGESLDVRQADAEAAREAALAKVAEAGQALFARRSAAASSLADAIGAELAGLGMSGAAVRFAFSRESDPAGVPAGDSGERVRPLENGLERVRLMFRSHPTEPEGEISRIASGGELSRVLLALHAALGEASPPGCWILDEVDAGIGGETARRVAARLTRMAGRAQVLLVTHLPAIAARARRHLCVIKEEPRGRPSVRIELLTGEARVRELARMLAGEPDSPTARNHARELLASQPAEDG